MRKLKIYHPPNGSSVVVDFLSGLDGKLRYKVCRQLAMMQEMPLCNLKEPHYKHFSLEKYNRLYELREKGKILVRIIFTIYDGDILLLMPFVKRQPRDTMRALEYSLHQLAEIKKHPEYVAEFDYAKLRENQEGALQ